MDKEWKKGDIAWAIYHDTGRWNKVRIVKKRYFSAPCSGLACNNRIYVNQLHGGGNSSWLHFCLDCLYEQPPSRYKRPEVRWKMEKENER
jgi:hypothetical protein